MVILKSEVEVKKSSSSSRISSVNVTKTADLVTFTEEILNEKFHFLCSVKTSSYISYHWCQSGIFVVYQKLCLPQTKIRPYFLEQMFVFRSFWQTQQVF